MANISTTNKEAKTPMGKHRLKRTREKAFHSGDHKPRRFIVPSGMKASINEAAKKAEFPPPAVIQTIRAKGYEWHLRQAKRDRAPCVETVTETSRILQVCGVAFVCFNN